MCVCVSKNIFMPFCCGYIKYTKGCCDSQPFLLLMSVRHFKWYCLLNQPQWRKRWCLQKIIFHVIGSYCETFSICSTCLCFAHNIGSFIYAPRAEIDCSLKLISHAEIDHNLHAHTWNKYVLRTTEMVNTQMYDTYG